MARTAKQLSELQIKSSKPQTKDYKLNDGEGLYLLVTATGSKLWRLKYFYEGKEKLASLGAYPDITLQKARELKNSYRQKVANGINPNDEKKELKKQKEELRQKEVLTFEKLALQALSQKEHNISLSHYKRTLGGFVNDVFPLIGNKSINEIIIQDIIKIFQKMRERNIHNSIKKVYNSLNVTFKWCIANGYTTHNPVRDIDLIGIIGKREVKHYATATTKEEIKNLIKKIKSYQGEISTKNALLFNLYTHTRPANIINALWGEIDFNNNLWTIPKEKMKTTEEHIVPLSSGALEILQEMKQYATSDYIFPNSKNSGAMSEGTMRMALRRQGVTKEEFTPHGFRSMLSTIAHEQSEFSHEAIEKHLSHSIHNSVSRAYNRAKYLQERKELMQWWSDYLDGLKG